MKSIIGYSWLIVTTIVMVAVLAFDLGQAETILLFAYFPVRAYPKTPERLNVM
jgi:hypothetical protein